MSAAPLQFLLLLFAGWVNRRQQVVIDYLIEENWVLREQLRGRRLRFTDDQRQRLARKGRLLARRVLDGLNTVVTPNTILRWYRELVAKKYDGTRRRRPGRPPTTTKVRQLIVGFATENPGVKCLKLPARSPDLNAYAERFVLSIKSECLGKIIPLGERHLRRAVAEFVAHYHIERNHQGLENRLIVAPGEASNGNGPVVRRERLGGVLNLYYRRAAYTGPPASVKARTEVNEGQGWVALESSGPGDQLYWARDHWPGRPRLPASNPRAECRRCRSDHRRRRARVLAQDGVHDLRVSRG
jgi:hypothetical protein